MVKYFVCVSFVYPQVIQDKKKKKILRQVLINLFYKCKRIKVEIKIKNYNTKKKPNNQVNREN